MRRTLGTVDVMVEERMKKGVKRWWAGVRNKKEPANAWSHGSHGNDGTRKNKGSGSLFVYPSLDVTTFRRFSFQKWLHVRPTVALPPAALSISCDIPPLEAPFECVCQ
jgi:hypothetical protein